MKPILLEKLTKPVKKWNPVQSGEKESFCYIDLSSVDQQEKQIKQVSTILPQDAPSRARQLVSVGDVLISTVRPNLNGVAYVSNDFAGATASTGFCVLRPNEDALDGRYLYHWVQSPQFVGKMVLLATGASYPAVSDRIVKSSKIPLPPLAEQKRIAAILDKADAIRRKRQAAIKLADDFLRATFLHLFGDPVTNPKGWKVKPLVENVTVQGGYAFKSKNFTNDGIKLVKITNVHHDKLSWSDTHYLPEQYADKHSKFCLKKDDILLSLTRPIIASQNSVKVAKVRKVDLPCLLNQRVGRFVPRNERVNELYLLHFCYSSYFKSRVKFYCSESLQPNVSTKQIEEILMPLPSLGLQHKFSNIVKKQEVGCRPLRDAELQSSNLFNSLTQRAFRGEL